MEYCILKSYNFLPDPMRILGYLKDEAYPFLLDSSLRHYSRGRFSFMGANPFFVLEAKGEEPFNHLRNELDKYNLSAFRRYGFPYFGGGVGFLSYDLGFLLERKIKRMKRSDLDTPEALFAFYNSGLIIDNIKKKVHAFSLSVPEKDSRLGMLLCRENIKKLQKILSSLESPRKIGNILAKSGKPELESDFSHNEYLAAVRKVKDYIKKGDVYQVNLTQRFRAKTKLSGYDIYRRLRELSPSCFSVYFDAKDFQILSSSPERFLQVSKGSVLTRPMKGTRPRSANRLLDRRLREGLLNSQKDRAELVMIVDLERNDLGKVCAYDSIRVNRARIIEGYKTVFQTVADIRGRLASGKDRVDLLRACFPGGSVTGCPKIRAMQIIEEIEPSLRSIYTGSFGYLSFTGDMDFNILIRTILKKGNNAYFGVGGGIVADSRPQMEYQESIVKAKAMIGAIA